MKDAAQVSGRVSQCQRLPKAADQDGARFRLGIVLTLIGTVAHAQVSLTERPMPAFEAICYRGTGPANAVDQSIASGLYTEVRNQGQAEFSPRIWFPTSLQAPYDFASVGEWHLCQEMASAPTKALKSPYFASKRGQWTAALLRCTATDTDGRAACVKALFEQLSKRNYGVAGALSRVNEGGADFISVPVVAPPPSAPPPASAPSQPASGGGQ